MNKEVPRRCKHGGCRNLTTNISGYCDQHSDDISKYRQSSSKRGYGYKWRKARERHLQLYPFCEECKRQGKPAVLATDVDHIVPHKGDPNLFWNPNNWQSLCHTCHSRKTAAEDGGFGRSCPDRGVPPLPSRFLTPPNVDRAVPSYKNYSHISFYGKMRKFLQVCQNGQKWNK